MTKKEIKITPKEPEEKSEISYGYESTPGTIPADYDKRKGSVLNSLSSNLPRGEEPSFVEKVQEEREDKGKKGGNCCNIL
jgi:hypothetical protein